MILIERVLLRAWGEISDSCPEIKKATCIWCDKKCVVHDIHKAIVDGNKSGDWSRVSHSLLKRAAQQIGIPVDEIYRPTDIPKHVRLRGGAGQ